ncbi:MAG: formate dehydrogenase subunit delta [Paracoccaceae bacterium]
MSPDKMVRMANQIATFFRSQPGDTAEQVAAHLGDFWDPRMRRQLLDHGRRRRRRARPGGDRRRRAPAHPGRMTSHRPA